MQLLNVSEKSQELTRVRTEHAGAHIDWEVAIYRRNNFKDLPALMHSINGFWATLPRVTQDGIFASYQEISEILNNTTDLDRLYLRLRKAVSGLYQNFTYQAVERWARMSANIITPTNVLDTYEDKPRDRTYLRNDYYDLALLVVSLQPMIPIFGAYIEKIAKQVGNNFKEQYAMGTLAQTWLIQTPGYHRLKVYVEAFVQYEQSSNAAIYNGLGTSELPDWLLHKALVRKVTIGEISVADNNNSVISNVYHYLDSNVNSLDRNFSKVNISEKGNPVDSGGDEDNMSFAETYKVKQEVPDDDIEQLSRYMKNYFNVAKRIDPSIPDSLVKLCVKSMKVLEKEPIELPQMTLAQWVLAQSIPPRALPSLYKPALLKALGVTQALLYHWGYRDLAALMVGRPYVRTDDYAMFTTEPRVRIPKDYVAQMLVLYPYSQQQGGKPQSDRQTNSGCRAVELLSYDFSKTYWTVTLPDALKVDVTVLANNTMVAPPDIKGQLTRLIIERLANPVDTRSI